MSLKLYPPKGVQKQVGLFYKRYYMYVGFIIPRRELRKRAEMQPIGFLECGDYFFIREDEGWRGTFLFFKSNESYLCSSFALIANVPLVSYN